MARLVSSGDTYSQCNISIDSKNELVISPQGKNLGTLPTLYDRDGHFVSVANSWFFDLKAVNTLQNLSSYSRALLTYWSFLENNNLEWNNFPPIKRLKPTYLFRHHLLTNIKQGNIAHSTANNYMTHVVQFYIWTLREGFLVVDNEKTAPFVIEFINISRTDKLAHMKPSFTVRTTDLRIRVPKNAFSHSVTSMNPLSQEALELMARKLNDESEEFRLQCLLAVQCGLRISEVCSLSIEALNFTTPLTDNHARYRISIGPLNGVKTKFGKERHIEISGQLLNAVKKYAVSERRLKRLKKLTHKISLINSGEIKLIKFKEDEFKRCEKFEPIFISEQGNPVDSKVSGARWTDFRNKIRKNEPGFTHKFHDLRCTYGTYRLNDLLDAGLPAGEALDYLMTWMGHNHEQTTWKYLRFLKHKDVLKNKFALLDTIIHEAIVETI
ncbi:site-specific integrase [Cronobacter sakazakii]|uniref:tyrosine-type recombinase/integrase n=1 Tax=Cronobacter sakazakii TaxID=28141 RepID=UPI0013120EB1|nr:site-specific integrase [Cronobacter sakazakii]KAB0810762.1 site-specific integrase [Cronobacter sakazakii]MDI7263731.1 site-specific integrase [Cronobacter sakazakii]MDI7281855.1 site-specific integrase [Cronobacter sakazakii]MDI7285129.1 site-specific integrase [Cronobacter sakazakii]MDI7289727.1 site-specific integrase [Cronobacter sakazakii]